MLKDKQQKRSEREKGGSIERLLINSKLGASGSHCNPSYSGGRDWEDLLEASPGK
jgi:hypothetical protein